MIVSGESTLLVFDDRAQKRECLQLPKCNAPVSASPALSQYSIAQDLKQSFCIFYAPGFLSRAGGLKVGTTSATAVPSSEKQSTNESTAV